MLSTNSTDEEFEFPKVRQDLNAARHLHVTRSRNWARKDGRSWNWRGRRKQRGAALSLITPALWAAPLDEVAAQSGDMVSVHYVGKFPGGVVFDTSMKSEAVKSGLFNPARDYRPLQVVLGRHQVISGFEEALIGMKINETKEITLPPEKAYGKVGRHPMAGKTLQFRLLVTNIKKP